MVHLGTTAVHGAGRHQHGIQGKVSAPWILPEGTSQVPAELGSWRGAAWGGFPEEVGGT